MIKRGEIKMKHADFSPSAAYRWLNCTESFYLHKQQETSSEAEEGTKAHALAEKVLKGENVNSDDYDSEMIQAVNYYTSIIDYYQQQEPHKIWVEKRVNIIEGCFGTVDCILWNDNELHIIDFKYGKGVFVDAKDNDQLKIYAIGAIIELKLTQVQDVYLHIIQPRYPNQEPHRLHKIDVKDLKEWGVNKLIPVIKSIKEKKGLCFNPSEHACRWCSHSGSCKALAEHNLAIAKTDFKDIANVEESTLPVPNELSNEQLVQIKKASDLFKKWLKAVDAEALRRARAGDKLPGLKLVEGRKNRKWQREEEALNLLKSFISEEAYTTKIITPAQAEKKLKERKIDKNVLNEFIYKPQGEPVLANENDKRKELKLNAEEEFKCIN